MLPHLHEVLTGAVLPNAAVALSLSSSNTGIGNQMSRFGDHVDLGISLDEDIVILVMKKRATHTSTVIDINNTWVPQYKYMV